MLLNLDKTFDEKIDMLTKKQANELLLKDKTIEQV